MIFNAYATKSPDTGGEITIYFEDFDETRVYDCNGRDTIENAPHGKDLYGWELMDEELYGVGRWGPEEEEDGDRKRRKRRKRSMYPYYKTCRVSNVAVGILQN